MRAQGGRHAGRAWTTAGPGGRTDGSQPGARAERASASPVSDSPTTLLDTLAVGTVLLRKIGTGILTPRIPPVGNSGPCHS